MQNDVAISSCISRYVCLVYGLWLGLTSIATLDQTMEEDFIPLTRGKSKSKIEYDDIYQDYIDNIDEEYKNDINRFVALSLDENPQISSGSETDGETDGEHDVEADRQRDAAIGSKISKSQRKKTKKEAKRLQKDFATQDSIDRNDNALQLLKILNKSKGYLDKSVVLYL